MSTDQEEPQAFRDFDKLYNTFVRCGWHEPNFKTLLREFEEFMSKNRELYKSEFIKPCIENARGHCRSAGVHYRF